MQQGKNSPLLNYFKIWKPQKPARQGFQAALEIGTFCTAPVQNVLFFCTCKMQKCQGIPKLALGFAYIS